MLSETFLAICVELADYDLGASLGSIVDAANEWQEKHERIMGIDRDDFPDLIRFLPALKVRGKQTPEVSASPADARLPEILKRERLRDYVDLILGFMKPYARDSDIGWYHSYDNGYELTDNNRLLREFFARAPSISRSEMRRFLVETFGEHITKNWREIEPLHFFRL